MRKAFIQELIKQARINKNIYLLVADVGYNLVEPFQQEFLDRFINVGIAEQSMIGIAAGLAMQGKKVFCYSLGNFPTLRCLEQIRNDVCYHNLDVKIVNSGAGLYYGTLGSSHHATEDIAVMRALPNMTVISPSGRDDVNVYMQWICDNKTPCYLRLQGSNDINSDLQCLMGDEEIVVLSTGGITIEAVEAVETIKTDKKIIVCRVLFIKPLDLSWLKNMPNLRTILTVEEHNLSGGLGSAVLEALSDMGLNTRVVRIGLQDKFCKEVGSQEYLRKLNGLDAESIANKIKGVLNG
ncbi:MAG: transketolase C-terminal domain-containing protein [Patescibacteria group bacterium]|jgi:transketolase